MPDITDRTEDISIQDNDSGDYASVNASNELEVHDTDVLYQLENLDIKNAWQNYVEIDKGFATTYSATIAGRDETDYMIIKNPTGSGLDMILKAISFSIDAAATRATLRLYKNPTVTADGTSIPKINLHDDTATGTMTTFHTPTVTARGNPFSTFVVQSSGNSFLQVDYELGVLIDPGKYLLLTIDPDSNNTSFSLNVRFAEDTAIA